MGLTAAAFYSPRVGADVLVHGGCACFLGADDEVFWAWGFTVVRFNVDRAAGLEDRLAGGEGYDAFGNVGIDVVEDEVDAVEGGAVGDCVL